jgi:hypothetical protein
VQRNVDYMRKLVVDTLNLARLDSGSLNLSRVDANPYALAESVAVDHQEGLEKAKDLSSLAGQKALSVKGSLAGKFANRKNRRSSEDADQVEES